MKIGIAGPATLSLLNEFSNLKNIPKGYNSPQVSTIINALNRRNHEVVLFTTSEEIEKPIELKQGLLTVCFGRRFKHPGRNLFREEIKDLTSLMYSFDLDVLNAQWTYEFALAALKVNAKSIITIRDNAINILKYQFDPYRVSRYLMNHITLNKADNLICNSQYIYTQLNKKYKKKAIVINNFLSDDIIKTLSSKQCKKGTDLITVSNGFSYYKNIKKALEAFALLKKNNPNLRYDLVGDDLEEGGKVHSFAMKKNLQHGVRFMGRIPYNEVLDRIKASRVLLHPSLEESFSMSVLEAMYLETMVVGGKNSGNIPYLLQYGKNGILCDVHSTTEIAQSIEKLLKNENDADTYTKNASKFIKEEFSEERQIEKLLSFYNKIA